MRDLGFWRREIISGERRHLPVAGVNPWVAGATARLAAELTEGDAASREEARLRYLKLLSSGGNDHPMTLLKNAGVDLSQPETVQATVDHLDRLVSRLEAEVGA